MGLEGVLDAFKKHEVIRTNVENSVFSVQECECESRVDSAELVGDALLVSQNGPWAVYQDGKLTLCGGCHKVDWQVCSQRFVSLQTGDSFAFLDLGVTPGASLISLDDMYGEIKYSMCGDIVALDFEGEDDFDGIVDGVDYKGLSNTIFFWKISRDSFPATATFVRAVVMHNSDNDEDEEEEEESEKTEVREDFLGIACGGLAFVTKEQTDGRVSVKVFSVETGKLFGSATHDSWRDSSNFCLVNTELPQTLVEVRTESVWTSWQISEGGISHLTATLPGEPSPRTIKAWDEIYDNFSQLVAVKSNGKVDSIRIWSKDGLETHVPGCQGWKVLEFARGVLILAKENVVRLVRFDADSTAGQESKQKKLKSN